MRSPRPAANTKAGKFFISKTNLASSISLYFNGPCAAIGRLTKVQISAKFQPNDG
jgi:hypothetical protein